jgi:hypothetical protein
VDYALDVVIPVLMPSAYIDDCRKDLAKCDPAIRINFVLDAGKRLDMHEMRENRGAAEPRPNERFFFGEYGAPGLARNAALENCDAKYVAFWDVDDKPVFEQALTLIKGMKQSEAQLGIAAWMPVNGGISREVTPFSVGLNPGLWRLIFSRELINDLRFSSAKWGEDQEFIARVLARNPKVFVSNEIIYRYSTVINGSQTSNRAFVHDLPECIKNSISMNSQTKDALRVVTTILILRQILTVVKYGDFTDKLSSALPLLTNLRNVIFSKETLRSFLFYRKKWK